MAADSGDDGDQVDPFPFDCLESASPEELQQLFLPGDEAEQRSAVALKGVYQQRLIRMMVNAANVPPGH